MATKTISISEEAYERLSRLKGDSRMSFSEVIMHFTPPKKRLSEVIREFGPNPDLADAVEHASQEMRKAHLREVSFNADS